MNWETQIAPERVGVLGKVKIRAKVSKILPNVGGVKEKCHMTKYNIGYKTVTSLKSVKRNTGNNRKPIKIKLLQVHPPSSHSTLKLSVKQKIFKAVQNGVKRVNAYASRSVNKTE